MPYERPAIEQRVKVTGPVITVTAPSSLVGVTPRWAPHDTPSGTGDEGS
jgi:hypothetical protein